ncbi:hypothetical protein BDV59DRAFT_185690 [Aspergillus ambiguus]|uniref:uncharacterized protein n=1 Tax=Aspergillus ambiguus TaxID=176160 RepID=UPI003CCDA47B
MPRLKQVCLALSGHSIYLFARKQSQESSRQGPAWYSWKAVEVVLTIHIWLWLTLFQLGTSRSIDLFRISTSVISATTTIFSYRNMVDGEAKEEDTWEFGQILPLLFLVLPLLQVLEMFFGGLGTCKQDIDELEWWALPAKDMNSRARHSTQISLEHLPRHDIPVTLESQSSKSHTKQGLALLEYEEPTKGGIGITRQDGCSEAHGPAYIQEQGKSVDEILYQNPWFWRFLNFSVLGLVVVTFVFTISSGILI